MLRKHPEHLEAIQEKLRQFLRGRYLGQLEVDEALIDDVVQETVTRLLAKYSDRPREDGLKLAYIIARRIIEAEIRRRKQERSGGGTTDAWNVDASGLFPSGIDRELFQKAYQTAKARFKDGEAVELLIRLRIEQNMQFSEAASEIRQVFGKDFSVDNLMRLYKRFLTRVHEEYCTLLVCRMFHHDGKTFDEVVAKIAKLRDGQAHPTDPEFVSRLLERCSKLS